MMSDQSEPSNTDKALSPLPPLENLPALLQVCIDRLNDAIVITEAEPFDDPGPRIVWANRAFFTRNGYTPEEIIGKTPRVLQGPLTDRTSLNQVRAALEKWQAVRCEILNYRKDGSTYWNELEIVPVADQRGWYTHWISVQRDVTERKNLETKLKEQASTDALTRLFNRHFFMEQAESHLARVQHGVIEQTAVLMIDIDFFKRINDTYGHAVGDSVLRHFASVMNGILRETDVAGRLGGEEFAVLMPEVGIDTAQKLAERLRQNIVDNPIIHTGNPIPVTVSIGISVLKNTDATVDAALIRADTALYRVKEQGRNHIAIHE